MKIFYALFPLLLSFFSSCSIIGFGIAMTMDESNYHDITNIDSLNMLKSPTTIRVSSTDGNTYKGTFKNLSYFSEEEIEPSSIRSNSSADTLQEKLLWELSFETNTSVRSLKNNEIQEIEKYSSSGVPSGVVLVVLGIVIDIFLVFSSVNGSSFNVGG